MYNLVTRGFFPLKNGTLLTFCIKNNLFYNYCFLGKIQTRKKNGTTV